MKENQFTGDKKLPMKSLLAKPEKRFIDALVPRFPAWIEGWHLTLLTIPFSVGLVAFGYLASRYSLHWLWISSLMLFLQWFTDSFDGALGRLRDFGIPKWGFYMDHFLDYIFMSCVFIGWSFLFQGRNNLILWAMVMTMGSLMVNSFLSYGATGEFKITYLRTGPTELRLAFVIINCLLIKFGTAFAERNLTYIAIAFAASVALVIFRTQRYIWAMDMNEKKERQRSISTSPQ
jgi:phosphatidylglycerophosphate synthase